MSQIEQISALAGTRGVHKHTSKTTGTDMTYSVFVPDHEPRASLPVLWYVSGLTCTHADVTEKGKFRSACAQHGSIFVAADTSPRGDDVPDMPDEYDFGQGAGFYLDAPEEPWAKDCRIRSYVEEELPALVAANFPGDMSRQGTSGHSMGGHGALTIALRNPGRFRSVSAFAPIVAPSRVPCREKALSRYLGDDRATWREFDPVALIEARCPCRSVAGRLGNGRQLPRRAIADPARRMRRGGDRCDDHDARRLRPCLVLHLDLLGRSCRLACDEAAWLI
jgi:S-formylglutathione hydrolase